METKNESCCRDALKHMGPSVCVEMRELKCVRTKVYRNILLCFYC